MFSFTADQLNLLLQNESKAKLAVEVGTTRYCTGRDRIVVGGNQYVPRGMSLGGLKHGESELRGHVEFDDTDQYLVGLNYSTHWSGQTMTWNFFLKNSGNWEEIFEITWGVRECAWTEGLFKMQISGNTGFRKRAGLSTMSRQCDLRFKGTLCGYAGADKTCNGSWIDCTSKSNTTQFRGFRYAPKPGEQIQIEGGGSIGFNTPPPSGDDAWSGLPPWAISLVQGVRDEDTQTMRPGGRRAPGPS